MHEFAHIMESSHQTPEFRILYGLGYPQLLLSRSGPEALNTNVIYDGQMEMIVTKHFKTYAKYKNLSINKRAN